MHKERAEGLIIIMITSMITVIMRMMIMIISMIMVIMRMMIMVVIIATLLLGRCLPGPAMDLWKAFRKK